MEIETIVRGGLFFDGRGSAPARKDIGIAGGQVVAIADSLPANAGTVIDARNKWVTPGFVDLHTHYDAEIEVAPALSESIRHGVTTCVLGSCSLSLALGTPADL